MDKIFINVGILPNRIDKFHVIIPIPIKILHIIENILEKSDWNIVLSNAVSLCMNVSQIRSTLMQEAKNTSMKSSIKFHFLNCRRVNW